MVQEMRISCLLVILFVFASGLFGVFDGVLVTQKMEALKTQMVKLDQARTAATTAKNTLNTTLQPYASYASNSTVITNAQSVVSGFSTIDAAYSPISTYANTSFNQAYDAYALFYAQSMSKDLDDALTAMTNVLQGYADLREKRSKAQAYFNEVVPGVEKPVF